MSQIQLLVSLSRSFVVSQQPNEGIDNFNAWVGSASKS